MPSALEQAYEIANRSYCAAKASRAANPFVSGGSGGILTERADLSRASEQYRHFNGWSYVAINAIAQRLASLPVYVGKPRKPARGKSLAHRKSYVDDLVVVPNHGLIQTIDDPNEDMTRWPLLYVTGCSILLTGRSTWLIVPSDRAGRQFDIWPIPTHWLRKNEKGEWQIKPPGTGEALDVPSENLAFFLKPDPGDPFACVSALQTQARAIDADEKIQDAQSAAFRNGIWPGYAIIAGEVDNVNGTPQTPRLEREQRQQIINAVKAALRGVHKFGEPLILDSFIKDIKPITTSPHEMDFLDSGSQIKSRIFQAFGINPLIVGEIAGANRAQAVVAEESFCSNVIGPLCELIGQTLTAWVVPLFRPGEKLVAWVECPRPNDPEQTLREWTLGLSSGSVTRQEYRTRVLGLEELNGMQVPLEPAGMMPAGDAAAADAAMQEHLANQADQANEDTPPEAASIEIVY